MPEHHHLEMSAPWTELIVTESDWDAADPHWLTAAFAQLSLIRAFEEYVLGLASDGLIHGPAHSSIGQEGGAVGSVLALGPGDTVNGSHRGHHQFLAKSLAHVAPKGIDPVRPYSEEVRALMLRSLAEVCGLERGFSHGRGGSMHLQWREAGAIGTNAIVGGGVPQAAGSAWAHKHAGTDAVAVTYFGDGATNIGSTLESLNLASAWRLPVCFFIENNLYAVSTSVQEATGEPRLSARGPGFGIASWKVDGMDTLAVHLAMTEAVAHMRAGNGPAVVEADVYRFFHQNGPFPGSAFRYRTREEEALWRARDPLTQIAGHLVRRGIVTQPDVDSAREQAGELMAEVGSVLLEPVPGGKPDERRIKAAEWPDPAFVDVGVRGDLSEFADAPLADRQDFGGPDEEIKFIDAVAGVMARRMSRDDRIVVMGEDIHRLNGGTNGATRASSRPTRTGYSARPSARTPSPAWLAVSRWTAGSSRWSNSCTPTSCGSRRTSSSTRSRRHATCTAAATICRSCSAARSRPEPDTARSTQWTPRASSPPPRAGASSLRRLRSTTSA